MTKLPKVVFVNVPSMQLNVVREHCEGKPGFFYVAMPTGILYLSAWAKRAGVISESCILDYKLELMKLENPTSLDNFVIDTARNIPFTPDIIALSANFTSCHEFLMDCVTRLKRLWPNAVNIVGGHHATACVPQILENESVDYVARGEGEIAFADFARAVSETEIIDIPGIYSSRNVKDLLKSPKAMELVMDLDELPYPDWDILEMETYMTSGTRARQYGKHRLKKPVERRVVTFSSNRGCPYQCTFCSSHLVHGRSMRFRSPELVIKELCHVQEKYGANVFFPDDDLFTANRKRMKNLLTLFRDKLPNTELQAPGGISVNTLDLEVLDLFIETGTTVISLAVESGSEYVQREIIKKKCNLEKAKEQVAHLRKNGVIVRVFFIIGFPEETREQMEETVAFAKELHADWCAFSVALPLPGSEMFDEFRDMGVVSDDLAMWATNFQVERNFDTPKVTAEEVQDIAYYANIEVNFLENANRREGDYRKAIDMYKDIVEDRPFHIVGWYCIMECLKALGEVEEGEEIHQNIRNMVKENNWAAEMYRKTHKLLTNMDHSGLNVLTKNKEIGYFGQNGPLPELKINEIAEKSLLESVAPG